MLHKPFTSPLDAPFIELPSVDSTNNYALAAIRQGNASHGTAIFTQLQTAGKGQMGKKWESQEGMNIALSIVIDPKPLTLTDQFQLSAAVAIAARSFLLQYAGDDVSLKWPNDLYWKDRKLGGILIESIIGGGSDSSQIQAWKWAVAGIGININQVSFSPELPNPVSLRQITGKSFDVTMLAKELHVLVLQSFETLLKEGFDKLYLDYTTYLYKRNQPIRLKKESRVFQAHLQTVSRDGRLITTSNNMEESFSFGEVSWVI